MPNERTGDRRQRLRAGGVEVLLEIPAVGLPGVVHWGADLGEATDRELERLVLASVPQVTSYVLDDPVPVAVLPEHALGWSGLPGVCGHRDDGSDWSPLFTTVSARRDDHDGTARVVVDAVDEAASLGLEVELEPRPALINTWEAAYFDTDTGKLIQLADEAARLGVERFVLDDGWFRGRRSEQSGLGDWYVDPQVWPDGLHPLVDHVRGLGVEFGLWFEPEGVSPDSDLARNHPDWVLATGGRMPPLSRLQQVLDLGSPGAWEYLLECLDALLDELRRRHRGVEIESCAGGGGRIDLGILEPTDRVWTSDSNDALERQSIQRWTGLLLPPELLGDPQERAELGRWVALYKQVRPLVQSGRVVRSDQPDPSLSLHGVVAQDAGEALYALVGLQTLVTQPPGLIRLPGLDDSATYRLRLLEPALLGAGAGKVPPWFAAADPQGPDLELSGRALCVAGIQAPFLRPESLLLLHLTRSGNR